MGSKGLAGAGDVAMLYKRLDLYLLLSLLLFILLHPIMVHGLLWRLMLGLLMFVAVILATVRVSEIKGWLWPTVLLGSGAIIFTLANAFFPNRTLEGIKWAILTAFCGLTVVVLFSFFRNARAVRDAHLYTAVSIYLLLGLLWFALYSAIEAFYPGSILRSSTAMADRSTELLYFSLVTLSTIGYGDVVPLYPEVRILAALEGITGVLYIAITVALLVSGYKQPGTSSEP
jgi:hypothetical protein